MSACHTLSGLLCCLTLLGQSPEPAPHPELHQLFRDYYEFTLRESPPRATAAGRTEYNDRWPDLSPAAEQRRREELLQFRSRLQKLATVPLNQQDQLSRELFNVETLRSVEAIDIVGPYNAVSHSIAGAHLGVFSTFALSPARTLRDYENLLARVRALPQFIDGLVQSGEHAIATKALQPRLVAELVLKQLDAQMTLPSERSPILAPFRSFPASIVAADQERLRRAAAEAYENSFRSSWTRYRSFIQEKYLPAARTSIGISDSFNGAERYRFLVRSATTTNLTPEQIHAIGQMEIARIQSEMTDIRREVGFSGTVEEFVEKVLHAPEMRFKSEAEILAHGREIAKRIDPELPRLFLRLPRMPYGVRAIPADRARTAAPYYERPAMDGTRAGNFYLRTVDPETQSKCCMESLIVHEAVPGHHLQNALAMEMEGVPEFRRSGGNPAYGEGWGLYAETLGRELGLYQTPYERYGQLQTELFRAIRLVVDTGIHTMGWSQQKALDLLRLAKGGFMTEAFLQSEIYRYIATPGQALAYKIGGLRIQELRSRAEKELGPKFDIREFHDAVLRDGSLPLDILESQINRYIAGKKADSGIRP